MTITSADTLSPDPEIREREIRAMREKVEQRRTDADNLIKAGGCRFCVERASTWRDNADRLQRRLDALIEGSK